MKLIDLVKRIEVFGFEIELRVDKHGTLQLNAWTVPQDGSRRDAHIVFSHPLDSKNNLTAGTWNEAMIFEHLEKASKHPDAVARRELQTQWAKEDEADAKRFARNAA